MSDLANRGEAARHFGQAKVTPKDTLLLPYQARWVRDKSRMKLAVKSRQIGWTWATAYALVTRKAFTPARLDAWISSRDEAQARLFLEDCAHFAGLLNIAAASFDAPLLREEGSTAHVLEFSTGLRIHSMSSNPDAQAGKRGDRVLDEFALHPDPRKLYAIAYPGITWGGSLEIFSTHRGSDNYFNTLLQEAEHGGNPKNFSLHKVSFQKALEEGFLHKLQRKLPAEDPRQQMDEGEYFDFVRRGCPDEETFLQEYMCQPSDDRSAFLSYDLIGSCEYPAEEEWEVPLARLSNSDIQLFVGVDIGRDHDLTVIWVLEKLADVLYTRRVLELKEQSFAAQEKALDEILGLSSVRRCCIDQTGLGRQFAERAQQRYGRYRVEGIAFTAATKEELAYPVRSAFESRALRIPGEPFIRADLRAIKKEISTGGNIRFRADRGKNGHADRFWALALAVQAAKARHEVGAMAGY